MHNLIGREIIQVCRREGINLSLEHGYLFIVIAEKVEHLGTGVGRWVDVRACRFFSDSFNFLSKVISKGIT